MSADELLRLHGTRAFVLKPASIAEAARADLRRRERNAEIRAQRKAEPTYYWGTCDNRFCFAPEHVSKATSPAELIELALKEPGVGREAEQYSTRLVYSDDPLLRAALAAVLADGVEP
jgi:hypothetical protein